MFFLNPLASTVKFWTLFFLGKDFLFKSILTWCVHVHKKCQKLNGDIGKVTVVEIWRSLVVIKRYEHGERILQYHVTKLY